MDLDLALRSHALFAGLDDAALAAVADDARIVELAGQELLYEQGAAAGGLYCVLRGRLRAYADGVLQHEVDAGGYCGEQALLTGAPQRLAVRAARDSTLLHLSAAGFQRLAQLAPVGLRLARDLALEARVPAAGVRAIAVVPLGAVAGFDRFVDDLVRGAGRAIACRATDPEPGFFARVEADHDLVAYVATPDDPAWSAACLRHADLVLAVADAGTSAQAPPAGAVPVDLVLLRPTGDVPGGTAAWLGFRQVHHAVAGRAGDAARVARLVTGRATGLALSGGASRATAYVGVFRALAEAGIAIDMVAGTSGGALLGAMHAVGWGPERMLAAIGDLDRAPFYRDLGPPLVSLLGGNAIGRILRGYFGETRLEDTPIRLAAACCSLSQARVVVPSSGPLWQIVQASCAVPGVFPPVSWEGDLLVDGGVMNNLPADLLAPACSRGRILAAEVQVPPPLASGPLDLHEVNGWRVLWRRWTVAARPPSLLAIMQQSGAMASTARRARTLQHAELLIQPLAGDPDAASRGLAAMAEAGYRETLRALEGLPAAHPPHR